MSVTNALSVADDALSKESPAAAGNNLSIFRPKLNKRGAD